MQAYATREEFKALENEVEGEKLVTRHILLQTQLNSNDLATIMKQVQGIQMQVQGIEKRVQGIESQLEGVQTQVQGIEKRVQGIESQLEGLQMQVQGIEKRLQGIENQLEGVDLKALVRKVDSLETRFSTFVRDFPATVADIMRQVLHERDEKKQ